MIRRCRLWLIIALALSMVTGQLPSILLGASPVAAAAGRVAYIYNTDTTSRDDFVAYLGVRGFAVDTFTVGASATADFSGDLAIVIGGDTGNLNTWGTTAAVAHLLRSGRALIGVGEGGYAFFGRQFNGAANTIGYGNGAHGSGTSIKVVDASDPLWASPNPMSVATGDTLALYSAPTGLVSIYDPNMDKGFHYIGKDAGSVGYQAVVGQGPCDLLWGFAGSPSSMTATGRDLFHNLIESTAGRCGSRSSAITGTARCGDSVANTATLRSGGIIVASQSQLTNGSFSFTGTAPLSTYTLDYAQYTVTLDRYVLVFSCSVSVTTDAYGDATAPAGTLIPDLGNHSFPHALPLTNAAGQSDFMAVAGRPNWYKISIAPGQRLNVTVRGAQGGALPVDLVLTLFGDIPVREAADKAALLGSSDPLAVIRRNDAGVAPDGLSPDGLSPDGLSPDGLSPDGLSPDGLSPDGLSPDGLSPDGLSPDGLSPDGLSPDGLSPDGLSPDGLSPDGLSPDGLSALYTSAQTESLLRVSDKPGTDPEAVQQNTWSNSGSYYIRVRGHNSAFSASTPYTVTATVTPVSCSAVVLQPTFAATTTATAGAFKSIILTNTKRLGPGTTALSGAAATSFAQTLGTFAGRSEVGGVVVDLGADTGASGAYAQWDATSDSKTCPAAANIVASTIKSIVDAYGALNPALKYVVIAGGDSVVPYLRVPDQAGLGNESMFQPPVALTTPSEASLRLGYTLTDGFYGSKTPIARFDHLLYLMDRPVGRLVESPADITTMITAYTSGYNAASGDVIKPTSALVTGYDFLADTAQFIAAQWASAAFTVDQTLISSTWTAAELAAKLLGPTKPTYGIVNLNGHFSANTALAADYATRLRTSDFAAVTDGRFMNMLFVSSGCHSGYNIVDDQIVPNVTQPLDWPQLLNGKGATLVGGTGYQYGDTDFRKYTELILSNFAEELRYGAGPVAVGDALASAKLRYLSQVATLSGTDEKALVESTLYGLPMFTVDLPGASRMARPGDTSVTPGSVNASGLSVATVSPGYVLNLRTKAMSGGQTASYYDATYGSTLRDVQATPDSQILPRVVQNVHVDGRAARGVILDHATFTNHPSFLPLTDSAAIETAGTRAYFTAPVMTPVTPFSLNTYGSENLILTPAQFRSTSVGSPTGTERTLDTQTLRVYYSSRTDGAALVAAPIIYSVDLSANGAQVDVDVTIGGSKDPGVETVVATYTLDENAASGSWSSVDLTAGSDTSTDAYHFIRHYTGTITSDPLAGPSAVRLFIQAVGGNALVSRATNNGAFYALQAPVAPTVSSPLVSTSLTLSAPTSAAYRSAVPVSATLTDPDGSPVAGKGVTFTFNGTSPTTRTFVTGTNGVATGYLRLESLPGIYSVTAEFNGDAVYLGTSTQAPLSVTRASTSFSPIAPVVTGDSALVATLVSGTRPLALEPITLTVGGSTLPTTTDGYGRVRVSRLGLPAGSNSYTIAFAGDTLYVGVTITGSITFSAVNATVTVNTLAPQPAGSDVTVTASVQNTATPPVPLGDPLAKVQFDLVNESGVVIQSTPFAPVSTAGTSTTTFRAVPVGLYHVNATVVGGYYTSLTAFTILAVYDTSTFATGGGWVTTTAASTGLAIGTKANFGFNAKYKSGSTMPTGSVELSSKESGVAFKATSIDWLVISAGKAEMQGTGSVNGVTGYSFHMTAFDAQPDTFELSITKGATTYYLSGPLGGGNIQIH